MTLEEALTPPTKATLAFIKEELTDEKQSDLRSQFDMLKEVDSDLKSMGINSINADGLAFCKMIENAGMMTASS